MTKVMSKSTMEVEKTAKMFISLLGKFKGRTLMCQRPGKESVPKGLCFLFLSFIFAYGHKVSNA